MQRGKSFKVVALQLGLAAAVAFSPLTKTAFAEEEPERKPLTEQERQELEQSFQKATEDYESARYPAAIEVYNTILAKQPGLHRARLELAVAYYKSKAFADARRQAQMVLEDPKTPEQVRIAIVAFLSQMGADEKKAGEGETGDWRFPLALGVLYDTNVNAGPDSDILSSVNVDPSSLSKGDWARVASVAMNHTYQSTTSFPIGAEGSSFIWQTGASIYDRDYFTMDDYDLRVMSLRMGPGLVANNRDFRANVAFQGDILVFGGEKLANFLNILPSYTWNPIPNTEITIDGVVSIRDYTRPVDFGRDSTYLSPRILVGYSFYNGRAMVMGGGSWFHENAEDARRTNWGTEGFIGGSWTFLNDTTAYGRLSRKVVEFEDVEPIFNEARDEWDMQELVGLRHIFVHKKDMGEWAINFQASFIHNDSNIVIYDYDREQYSLNIEATF